MGAGAKPTRHIKWRAFPGRRQILKRQILRLTLCVWSGLGCGLAHAQTIVQAATAQPAIWRSRADVAASLAAQQTANLSATLAGTVTGVYFTSGAQVAAGQVLVQLDDGPGEAQLALDQAKLVQAGRDLARTEKLLSINGASTAALELASAELAEAKAQVGLDQANLAQLRITAPFAGVVGIRNIDPGDYLQAGQNVVTLTGTGPLRVLFSVPQTEAGGLALGDDFTLRVPAGTGPAEIAEGQVTALSPQIDAATNARAVEGRIISGGSKMLPGMSGVLDIATGVPLPAFAVPSAALNDSTLGPLVFRLAPGKDGTYLAEPVYVTIDGDQSGDTLISTAGLRAGDKVVALGGFKLNAGDSVSLQGP